jgi:hypothetical protein
VNAYLLPSAGESEAPFRAECGRGRHGRVISPRRAAKSPLMEGLDANVVSRIRVDDGWTPLTPTTSRTWGSLLASADENASAIHPLPQRGEGKRVDPLIAPLGDRKAEADSRGDILPARGAEEKKF